METPFNFDREIDKILPPSQETLWALYHEMKGVCCNDEEGSSDLYGELPIVLNNAVLSLDVRIHPFPEWDAVHRNYRAASIVPDDGGSAYELWCNRDNIFELRGHGRDQTEEQAKLLLSYFAPPQSMAA